MNVKEIKLFAKSWFYSLDFTFNGKLLCLVLKHFLSRWEGSVFLSQDLRCLQIGQQGQLGLRAWLVAGTFLLPQKEPEGFTFFLNTIHQLGSCLPISTQIRNCSKSSSLPTPPSQADTCTHRSNAAVRLLYYCIPTNKENCCVPL